MSNRGGPRDVLREMIFNALVEAPSAWQTTSDLARALGFDHEVLCDELAAMDIAGLIAVWERPDDVAVAVAALAARARGLCLVRGASGVWRWEPAPKSPRAASTRPPRPSSAAGLRQPPRGPDTGLRAPVHAFQNPWRAHNQPKLAAVSQGMS